MSARAAWRLESLGFDEVYDYVGSKMEWMAEDLPFEGTLADRPRLSTLADRDVPTCQLAQTAAEAHEAMGAWDVSLVVTEPDRVLLGMVRAEDLEGDGSRRIGEVMQEAPSTYRPHVSARKMSEALRDDPAPRVVVTTISGRLVGIVRPDDIHAAARS